MKKIFLLMSVFIGLNTYAENKLIVSSVTVPQGGSASIDVILENTDNFAAFEYKLELPSGISLSSCVGSNRFAGHNIGKSKIDETKTFISCYNSDESTNFLGNEGTLMTINISADESLNAGTELVAKIYDIEFSDIDMFPNDDFEDVVFTITIEEPGDGRITFYEESDNSEVLKNVTGVDVRVKRTIKADEWSTICLPFSMTETQVKEAFGDNVQLGEFNGVDYEFDGDDVVGITVNFTNTQSIEANHPYIIKVSQPVSEFTLDGVDIVADEDEAYIEFDNGKTGSRRVVYSGFYGTYHAQTVLDKFTLFLSDNKFWYSMGLTTMKAFRAYFEFLDKLTDVENASNIKLWVNNDEVDSLQSLSGTPIMGGNTYNLAGQRVGKNYKGIIIESGKKVMY